MISKNDSPDLTAALRLHQAGQLGRAADIYRQILDRNPGNADAAHYLGLLEAAEGKTERATSLIARSLELQPSNAQFRENYATILCEAGCYDLAIQICDEGLCSKPVSVSLLYISAIALFKLKRLQESLQRFDTLLTVEPDHLVAINERGTVLAQMGEHAKALAAFEKAVEVNPKFADAHLNTGNLLGELGRQNEAKLAFEKALALNPKSARAWSGLGKSFREQNLFDEALSHLEKAVALDSALPDAWLCRGNVFWDLKRFDEALAVYNKAVTLKPDLVQAWLGRGNVLCVLKSFDGALAAYSNALALEPDLAEAWLGRGNVFLELKHFGEALPAYDSALASDPTLAQAWLGRGNVYASLKEYDKALSDYDRALGLEPDLTYAQANRLSTKQCLCDWTNINSEIDRFLLDLRGGKPSFPFFLLSIPSTPEDQLQCARAFVRDQGSFSSLWRDQIYSHDRIRIAYLSGDFHEHAIAYLTAGLFENHNKSQFEVHAISFGPNQNSDTRRRIASTVEHFIDVQNKTDQEIAQLIRQLEIDILIDLKGYTSDARYNVLARRPAPVQVNYLGYPGTMGADYVDYIVADSTIIPEEQFPFYSERVIWMPHSYQVNDSQRLISEHGMSREECGLPEEAFVFCCFNNPYKILPEIFEIWVELLRRIERSVFWLFEEHPAASANLRKEAEKRGVSADRLVFAHKMPLPDHLARHRHADLFLDTLPYNAHTTASDALWAGLPVLTCLGKTFAGRVGESLLRAVGLPELVAGSLNEYQTLALKLANEPALLAAIRAKLAHNRNKCPLFHTARFTRHIEAAYVRTWEQYRRGDKPESFAVTAID
jgi:protein O-GlcNAc transferase